MRVEYPHCHVLQGLEFGVYKYIAEHSRLGHQTGDGLWLIGAASGDVHSYLELSHESAVAIRATYPQSPAITLSTSAGMAATLASMSLTIGERSNDGRRKCRP
jgi:hypothetical protein